MKIYINTFKRERQDTYESLGETKSDAVLVIYAEEAELHKDKPCLIVPEGIRGLSAKRQFILEHHFKTYEDPRLIIMDDDLTFSTRREDDPSKFARSTPAEIDTCLYEVWDLLKTYAHAGIIARQNANQTPLPIVTCSRMMRVLGYDAKVFNELGIRFDRVPYKQDLDVTLQLLRAGKVNALTSKWCQDHRGSNTKGGCAVHRTPEKLEEAGIELARLHPEFVKLVQKKAWSGFEGETRTDVQIQWRSAYESSQKSAVVKGFF